MSISLDTIKSYLRMHSRKLKIGFIACGSIMLLVLFIGLYMYNVESQRVKMDYSPVSACALFTNTDATSLLGKDIIDRNTNQATVSSNRAVSKCSYTDKSISSMSVIAVAVKSAINNQGIQDNKDDFVASKTANKVEIITGLGDDAFYIPANGQLNILYKKMWILVSYGTGDDIATYTLDNAMKVARVVMKSANR